MSYAYDVTRSDFEEIDGVQVRNIREVKLYDVSDVTWGMNPATVAAKSKLLAGLPLSDHSETVLAAAQELIERYEGVHALRAKAGRVLSAANVARLATVKESLTALVTELEALLAAAEPEKTARHDLLRLRSASHHLRQTARELGVHV
jgi:DNA primase large subunit